MSFANDTTKTKPRILTVAYSCRNHPRITLSGAWLLDWGFNIGDRISLLFVEPGNILVRTGSWPDWPAVTHDQLNEPAAAFPSPVIKGDDLRSYALYPSRRGAPEIKLTGAWLRKWGFAIDDRIQLTWKREHYFHIQVVMPAKQWREVKRKKEFEVTAMLAMGALAWHSADHPDLYVLNQKVPVENASPLKAAKRGKPSLYEQTMTATREYNANLAALGNNILATI
jgi:hypothetical protein